MRGSVDEGAEQIKSSLAQSMKPDFAFLLKASAVRMSSPISHEAKTKRRGRRVALGVYGVFVGAFILIASGNVAWQVFGPSAVAKPEGSCTDGLRELVHALERAREAASSTPEESESAALSRFRSALLPEWGRQGLVAATCHDDRELRAALDTIERLRYAEEHAVRLEATELAPLRLAVRKLMEGRLGSSTKK